MPLYDFECKCGKVTEKFLGIADLRDSVPCEDCGGEAIRVISLGHGGVFRDEPVWLDHNVRKMIQGPYDKIPITNRVQLKKHLKEHNISQVG